MINKIRRGYELKGMFLNRPIRPFHLAVTIATFVVAITLWQYDEWVLFTHTSAHVVGAVAFISSGMLTWGWWFRSEWVAEWGLLLATGVWVSRAVYAVISDGGLIVHSQWASVALSLAWAIGAGGAYLLERYDHEINQLSD